ncbi:circadian clock protein KaiC [Hymenobacter sp. RP-2-7]|uniref:non-specific serine/threonine protein kinase n=1 Tax=Hymenobacter polaris TaxID=2682546 RepID=A0A7Y0AAM0_9BACT|nr:circadian clock protein KaiC [Hymenobacter polaris]NML63836.1 circadian clock protein KaiC [Hymenobacter polaris]
MSYSQPPAAPPLPKLPKAPTGIAGLDEITEGGLPLGRPTLLAGAAGCGKTLLGIEFLVRGVLDYHEPGVLMTFEESADELAANVASLGFDLRGLEANGQLALDHVQVDRAQLAEAGDFDLEGLFIRLGYAIDQVGAKRVVLDTLEALFGGFHNEAVLRSELQRLFRWLKDRGVTTIITAERGEGHLTRQGLEEYVSDCVIVLDNRVVDQVTTRRLRVVKYRGSTHGTNEYPYIITETGISVLPITSLQLDYPVSSEIISSGVAGLDEMFTRRGWYRGSSVLISGTAGTAKTTLAAAFALAACQRGERTLYFAFEESGPQLIRNMRSVGLDLQPVVDSGLLHIEASRPTLNGLERHLVTIHNRLAEFKPSAVVVDPISNLVSVGSLLEVRGMLTRLIDYLKVNNITALFTALVSGRLGQEMTEEGIASLADVWLTVRDLEGVGERNRGLSILKARGMAHSNQVREFLLTDDGVQLLEVVLGAGGIITGTGRQAQRLLEERQAQAHAHELARKERELTRKRLVLEASIANLRTEFESVEEELRQSNREAEAQQHARQGLASGPASLPSTQPLG